MEKKILIFTDGAAKGNPGPGGYGAVVLCNDQVLEIGARKDPTTNNEMELKAVVEALKEVVTKKMPVAIYSDSKYVVEGAKGWIFGWANNGWQTKAKTDVLNKELWQELLPMLGQVEIEWHKVPGHVGIIGNERADTIASDFGAGMNPDLYVGARSEYGFNIEDTSYDKEEEKKRSAARKRQSQQAYSYVSMVDGSIETHTTWKECEARVKGKRARFKKTLDANEEKEIIAEFGG